MRLLLLMGLLAPMLAAAQTRADMQCKATGKDLIYDCVIRLARGGEPVNGAQLTVGADMPSILTEISFLSNPADEKMLKQPEHRQRVAEGIYQGVASYLQSLNSMGMNATTNPAPKRTATSASVESSRNRN